MRHFPVWAAPLAMLLPVAAQAQTLGAVENRINRLEQSVEKLERKTRKLRDEVPASTSPVPLAAPPASGSLVIELNNRIEALERLVAGMVASDEQDRRAVAAGLDQLQRLKGDAELRLDGVEQQLVKLAAAAEAEKAAPPPPAPKALTADDRYLEALDFAERKEWSKAEFAFDTFIAANPGHSRLLEARYWLGRSFQGQGKTAQAAQIFLELFEKQPAAAFALDNLFALAQALVDLGPENTEQACAVYDQIEEGFKDKLGADRRNALLDQRIKLRCPT